jgi:predicted outer membrane repeat protein
MGFEHSLVGRRGRVLSSATRSVIEPLETRRMLAAHVGASGASPLLLPPPPPSGTTYYVDPTATGNEDGETWQDAFPTLQDALSVVQSGDQIDVAQGTYTPGDSRTDTFLLFDGVTIQGGYGSLTGGLPYVQDPNQFQTILSGNIGDPKSSSDNSYHVVTSDYADVTTVLDGVTISGGYADGSGDADSAQGAGMYNTLGFPTISNCTFTNNFASNYGAGMFDDNASPSLNSCTFTMNTAEAGGAMANVTSDFNNECRPQLNQCTFTMNNGTDFGGAIYDFQSAPTLENSTFTQNSAQNIFGGAIYDVVSQSSVDSCTFSQNSSAGNGGAICDFGSEAVISSSSFTGNSSGGSGGALYADSFIDISGCTFTRNSAAASGGAVITRGNGALYSCIFGGNTAGNGGAVLNSFANSVQFVNCAFVGNTATAGSNGNGGAVDNEYASGMSFTNCTLTDNTASGSGGGIYDFNSYIVVTNGILWQDSSTSNSSQAEIYDSDANSQSTVTYSDVSGVSGPNDSNNINIDPGFRIAPNAGTDNTWGTADDDYGDLQLNFASMCIDVGNNSAINQLFVSTDLAGNNRIQGGVVDLGAYEAQIFYVAPIFQGSGNGDDWADAADLAQTLANAPTGSLVKAAQGTYDGSFQVPNGVTILGGYAGPGTANPNMRDLVHLVSTLDGQGISLHVVTTSNDDAGTVLDGFTITGGSANGFQDGVDDVGGGIYNSSGSPTISNCIITGNSALEGGGMYNTVSYSNIPSAPTLTNCTFSNNTGGAMQNQNASPTLSGCTFTNNSGNNGDNGAAINNDSSQTTLTDCTFTGNTTGIEGSGGAIYNLEGDLSLTGCTFTSNIASDSGGAIACELSGTTTLVNCLFARNTAAGSQSFGGTGGAIEDADFASVTMTNCTFSDNAAVGPGSLGGAFHEVDDMPVITNCIFWNDSATSGNEIYDDPQHNDGSVVSHSDVDGGFAGTDNINADPLFVDPVNGNYQLQSTSPAIDAGDDTAIAGTSTDLAGNPRISGVHVDMGAYEVQPGAVIFSVTSTSFDPNASAPTLNFTFNGDVDTTTIDLSDVFIHIQHADGSLGGGPAVSPTSTSYDSTTKTVSFILPTNTTDGYYLASMSAGMVKDTSGDLNAASMPYQFFILAGDANHDRTVNLLDLNALASNFGLISASFKQGDFDYSGTVGITDFNLLAGNFGKTLAAPSNSSPVIESLASPEPTSVGTNHSIFSSVSIGPDLIGLLDPKTTGAIVTL